MKIRPDATKDAYKYQAELRDKLVESLRKNHNYDGNLQYEKLFMKYYPQLNEKEKILFELIRGVTENSIYKNNTELLDLLEKSEIFFNT